MSVYDVYAAIENLQAALRKEFGPTAKVEKIAVSKDTYFVLWSAVEREAVLIRPKNYIRVDQPEGMTILGIPLEVIP